MFKTKKQIVKFLTLFTLYYSSKHHMYEFIKNCVLYVVRYNTYHLHYLL